MKNNKLYVLEWDAYAFVAISYSYKTLNRVLIHDLQNIKEVNILGEILNNTLFIVMDGRGDYYGIYATKKEAEDKLYSCREAHSCFRDYNVEEIKIL